MAHQVLARKWRPSRFDEGVGQAHVVQALTNALNQNYLHHAYLFTGTRGVGKTTIARIIAKCLNCEKGISANPCGECSCCKEIDAGRFPDLYEVDAASRTKVEDTRELLDNVQYTPTKGRFKIYLIDEVHMLSGHSFNALLKTLEEPPEHVKFLLATTDPQKLPATVLSRCLQFHLLLMTPEEVASHLANILDQEKIEYEQDALHLLGKAANGSMRDSLSLLDQAIAFGNGKVLTQDVKTMLGTIESKALYDIVNALSQQDANQLIQSVDELANQGADFSRALNELLSVFHQISVTQMVANIDRPELNDNIRELAQTLSTEDTQLFYQIGLIGQRDLPLAPTPRSGFEMVLLRMLAFIPDSMNNQNVHAKKATPRKSSTSATSSQATTAAQKNTTPNANSNWHDLLNALNLTGPTFALAQQCALKSKTDAELCLALSPKHKAMLNSKHVERIQHALTQHFDKPMTVKIDVENPASATPAGIAQQQRQDQQKAAETAIMNDLDVQRIMQTFDATVMKDSIAPAEQH